MMQVDKRILQLHRELNPYKSLVTRTRDFIRESLSKVERPYVACSFGKDSSVMLHLVVSSMPGVRVKFLTKTETYLIDNYAEATKWWVDNHNIDLEVINYRGWLEGGTATGIAKNINAEGYDSFFVGIRQEESVGRRITLRKDGKFFMMKEGRIRVAPLSDWKTIDVAAYMVEHDLPILGAYMREGFDARTTSNIPSKYPHEAVSRLKDANMSAYNELMQILPLARFYS